MIISALNEGKLESRVAISPSVAQKLTKLNLKPSIEQDAGLSAGFENADYEQAGTEVIKNRKTLLKNSQILLSIDEIEPKVCKYLSENSLIIGPFDKELSSPLIQYCLNNNISLFSMNLIPRISRAQSMDSLSSQANLAGYRAVLEAIYHYQRVVPMMMTAAGMIHPAKVLVLGAGVAGLQAIATAQRLGAEVFAFDVRPEAKEQVESLGAEFVEVESEESMQTEGGYAKEATKDYQAKQAKLVDEYAKQADIVITTALIPGRPAPILLKRETVEGMKKGSVIVDLATSRGGNCELSVEDKTIQHQGVTIVGISQLTRQLPATASELYGNNCVNLLKILVEESGRIKFNEEDQIIQQALLCHKGQFMPFEKREEKQS